MTFNPHTEQDRAEMLAVVGKSSVADLFTDIPADIRFPTLELPPALTEMEAAARLAELAAKNMAPAPGDTYLGVGSYSHYIPATVGQILSRGEFYTAYTPYQPEVAQGTLQVIYEFQSLVATLLGTEVANASLYDGATAMAEGVLMAMATAKGRNRVVLSGTVHPHYADVVTTYTTGLDIVVDRLPTPIEAGFMTTVDDITPMLGPDVACVVVQYPNFFGGVEDIEAIGRAAKEAGAALLVSTTPMPLGLLTPPGELGADIVTAEGQPMGVAQSFGGPYVGLLGARKSYLRQMPGRLAGVAQDSEGKRGFVLTLQTREQHIRREKATSNICTNQGLMATAATVYMASVGPQGLREVATSCYQHAHYLAGCLVALDGYELALAGPFFHEFVVKTPEPVKSINVRLAEQGIIGGYDLGHLDESLDHHMVICATELNTRTHIDRLVGILKG